MTQVVARKATQQPTVTIGKLKVSVAGGNIGEWAKGEVPEALEVSSQKGRHSAELAKLAGERTRIASLVLTVAPANASGEQLDLGSLAIEIKNGRIKRYEVDGKTETWVVSGFDGVHRTKTTRKVS